MSAANFSTVRGHTPNAGEGSKHVEDVPKVPKEQFEEVWDNLIIDMTLEQALKNRAEMKKARAKDKGKGRAKTPEYIVVEDEESNSDGDSDIIILSSTMDRDQTQQPAPVEDRTVPQIRYGDTRDNPICIDMDPVEDVRPAVVRVLHSATLPSLTTSHFLLQTSKKPNSLKHLHMPGGWGSMTFSNLP